MVLTPWSLLSCQPCPPPRGGRVGRCPVPCGPTRTARWQRRSPRASSLGGTPVQPVPIDVGGDGIGNEIPDRCPGTDALPHRRRGDADLRHVEELRSLPAPKLAQRLLNLRTL